MPNGYSVGNLELDITALDKSATSFTKVINNLSTMLNLVTDISTAFRGLGQINNFANGLAKIAKIDLTPVANNIQKIPKAIEPIANLGNSFKGLGQLTNFANGLNKLSQVNTQEVYKKFSSISRIMPMLSGMGEGFKGLGQLTNFANGLQKIVKLDVAGFDTQIKALTASLRPFLQEITVATPALTAFATAMASVKGRRMIGFKQFDQTSGGGKNLAKTLNLAGILGKIYFIRNYTKQLANTMVGLVQNAIDYTETLNLWQVAMRGNISTAEEFVSKMNKAYGIAEETLMRYQATFRNMLSTLGGISTDVSYALSEYLTQMALDYASLYNTSIEKAMTVFQSVLSGQVRPIRSISGYDITETTIFELYQQLGGTKTMRQLTQTEKRLLRIYAVFQQMDRSGAIGDLNKTLNNTANQMRIMSEVAEELGTWVGKFFELYLADYLPYINAMLIVAKDLAKAVVQSLPNYEEFDGTIAGFEETADAIDQVQGKLLDFDKFRSLSGNDNQLGIGIDETLISGMTRYQSILENVTNRASKLAEEWKIASGLWDSNGAFNLAKWEQIKDDARDILDSVKNIALLLVGKKIAGSITAMSTTFGKFGLLKGLGLSALIAGFIELTITSEEFRNSLLSIWNTLKPAINILSTLFVDILGNIVPIVAELIKATDQLGLLKPAIYILISYGIAKKIMSVYDGIVKLGKGLLAFGNTLTSNTKPALLGATQGITKMQLATSALAGVLGYALGNMLLSNLGEEARSIVAPIMLAVGAITSLTMAFLALQGVMSWGTALPVITAGVGVAIAGMKSMLSNSASVDYYANGGMPDKGSVFVAGEAGAEMVYNTPSGQSGVANISQIAQADYSGTRQALNDWWSSARKDIPAFREVSKTGIYEVVDGEAKRRGKGFANR